VQVHEWFFSSVGRVALSLKQRAAQSPCSAPSGDLLIELATVLLIKDSRGIYLLDQDSGAHDGQSISLALAVYSLLD
jgi:hypothetical protein